MNKILIVVFIIIGIAVIIGLEILVFKTVSKKSDIPPDAGSTSRMQQLNNVLRAKFGNNWPFVLIFIIVLLLLMFILLYFVLKKDTITWNMSERTGKILSRTGIVLAVLISLSLVGLGTYAVIKEKREHDQQTEENGDFGNESKAQQFLEMVGLIIALVVIIVLIAYGIHHHRQYEKSLQTTTSV